MHTAAFWFLERGSQWQPDDRLLQFLERGEPPVFVGFGSMRGTDPANTTQIVLDAIRQALDSDTMQQKADALGRLLRQEDGIATAVKFIGRTVDGL